MLYECPKLGMKTRLSADQCERNQVRAEKAEVAPWLCGLGVRGVTSEPLIYLEPCVLCPGVRALSRIGVIPLPAEYDGPTEWDEALSSTLSRRVAPFPSVYWWEERKQRRWEEREEWAETEACE